MYFKVIYYQILIIFSISILPILCKNGNDSSISSSPSLRWPLYHELFFGTMKSASFISRYRTKTLEINETAGDFCFGNSSSSSTEIDFDSFSNSTDLNAENNGEQIKSQLKQSLSEDVLKIILQRFDLSNFIFSDSTSMDCLADLYYFGESVKKMDAWALKVVDSLAKLPSGVLTGSVVWPGNYDQCLEVAAPLVNITLGFGPVRIVHNATFDGQYCRLSIIEKSTPPPPVAEGYLLEGLTIGICAPKRCTGKMLTTLAFEVEKLFNKTLFKYGLRVGGVDCSKKKDYLDGPGIVAVIVLTGLLILVAVGTVYEGCILRRRAAESKKVLDDVDVTLSEQQNHFSNADDQALIDDFSASDGVLARIITSFSLITNGRRLFSLTTTRSASSFISLDAANAVGSNSEKPELRCLHGIRFLSMAWVILGNTYYFSFAMTSNPLDRLDPDKHDFWFQAIIQAAYAVDSFFLISACLVATQFFAIADRYPHVVGTCRFWLQFYLQRFLRLTPPYMLILCVYIGLWKYVGEGPFWPSEGFEVNDCRRTWWSNLLYINNFLNIRYEDHGGTVSGREYCAGWTWYLANDMQFYWISPLVLYPIFKSRQNRRCAWLGYGVLATFIAAGLIVTGVIARVNVLPPNMFPADLNLRDKAQLMKDELYFKPYPHLPCYALGIILALALRRYKQRNQQGIKKIYVVVGWSLSFSFAMAIIYGLWPQYRGHPFSADLSACYVATSRTVFAACVAWVAYACLTGHGGLVNRFLSWSFFLPLSRLTFCAYLIHPMLLFAYFFSRRTTFYYTEFIMVWFFGSFLLFSYVAAIGVALVFESPFLTLNRRFVKRGLMVVS